MVAPYDFRLIAPSVYGDRRPVEGLVVALLHVRFEDRGLRLIETRSRAVRLHDIHELMTTDEDASPGGGADRVRAVAFFEVDRPGLIVAGDMVTVDGEPLGALTGFDEAHMPNHMGIVVKTPSLDEPAVRVGSRVRFSAG
ncbi:hypothetical protein A3K81_03090 [Candidatus Bathyarchaeota archaeon RBG_13_60_20]|jgi:hypothetical protein|nr:MAG: hypothetical protein A3K81_03090 [Candidatus Bathyarchaeota archaeon RBG_13_60_20]